MIVTTIKEDSKVLVLKDRVLPMLLICLAEANTGSKSGKLKKIVGVEGFLVL